MIQDQQAVTVAQWVEVHRLAVAGQEPVIARHVGDRVAMVWLRRSRFSDVEALANATLTLGPDAGAFYDLGWAQSATGRPQHALASYAQALHLYREAGDRGNEAATLTNIGSAYDSLGEPQRALTYYQQALPITREVGDRAGEATTLSNIGLVYHERGDPHRALTYCEQALSMMREIGDRLSAATTLNNIGGVYKKLGDPQQALTCYQQALLIRREVGDRAGEARTLSNVGATRFQEGDLAGAKDAIDEVVEIFRVIGDRGSEAVARFNMAVVLREMTRVDEAIESQRRAVDLAEQTSHPALDQMRAFLTQLEQTRKELPVRTAVLEVSGPDAARGAAELHAALAANAGPGDEVSPVEVQRSAELVIAVIGLVFAGVGTAKTIWDWWHSRRTQGVSVTILLGDGTRVEVANVSRGELELVFQQVESRQR